jgi:hypothetical protein
VSVGRVQWRRFLVAALAAANLLALAGGCERNRAGLLLAPTGVRPAPAVPTGGMWGYLFYDLTHYVGLDTAPFPPTRVTVSSQAGLVVDSLLLDGSTSRFEFDRLPPGKYTIGVRSHAFKPGSFGPYTVSTEVRDVGNLGLISSGDSLAGTVYVIGTIPGFSTDEFFTYSTLMDQNDLGVYTYPSVLGSNPVPGGTWRFKFVTDASSTMAHLIGWGGDSTQVLTVPIVNQPVRWGTGPVSDLKVTFPATGTYLFTFDERRLTFSISLAPAPARPGLAAFRRMR